MNVVNESGLLMFYVYILQSINFPEHFYVGCTNDLKRRLKEHNNGNSVHTNKFKPWDLRDFFYHSIGFFPLSAKYLFA